MAVFYAVPAQTIADQRRAADPATSAWVSANAGSGKTTVLTRRVIRLLLTGAAPQAILCLTFTKAAAANMQNRIFETLGKWATLTDDHLSEAVATVTGGWPGADELVRARRLFARAIETPGGLKILTIHGFCERVLHLFPFEANVSAQFAVLEDRGGEELLAAARASVLDAARRSPETPLGLALAHLLETVSETSFDALMAEITRNREPLRQALRGGLGPAVQRQRRVLELAEADTVAALGAAADTPGIAPALWPALIETLQQASGTMAKLADKLAALTPPLAGAPVPGWSGLFLTKENKPVASIVTKAVKAAAPDLAAAMQEEAARIALLAERRLRAACAERSAALLALADALIRAYARGKAATGSLDFDDLIVRTRELLERAGAEWVLYKLDAGIDHILVDEAQDTSPGQWRIVEKLSSEFTAGQGARGPRPRTLFAVGDEKQSIFSFQGAAPAEFSRMKHSFAATFTAAGQDFEDVPMTLSFRSAPDILAAVDRVFADPANHHGLSSDSVGPQHEAIRADAPGRVEIWPVERPEPSPDILAWDAPFDETPASSPANRVAQKIAAEIRALIDDGDPATGARFDAGDFMVLVRSRNAVFEAVIRALKRAQVPVAGADRLVLMDHIAVMDLVALGQFTLLPADDLTLATVLKSPLIGFDDDDLMRLAPGREQPLWDVLQGSAAPRDAEAVARLIRWLDAAAHKTPFAFYADVLAGEGGRRIMLHRFGAEAADALDEFLSAAAAFEQRRTGSLQGFLASLAATKVEIKRDMDVARGEVRVMTVHGAKGLEAKVVFLADTTAAPHGRHAPSLYFLPDPRGAHRPLAPLWSPNQASDPDQLATERLRFTAIAEGEHRRLLYVAMTRAEDRLILTGFEGVNARRTGNWYDMVRGALLPQTRLETVGEDDRMVFEVTPRRPVATGLAASPPSPDPEPDWARRPAPPEPAMLRTVRPSQLGLIEAPIEDGVVPAGEGWALRRGTLIHGLLQVLPGYAEAERRALGEAWLAAALADRPAEAPALLAETLAILASPQLAFLFGPDGRAEVPVFGFHAGENVMVSGRIDRLIIRPDSVLIVDFKTNARPPAAPEDTPAAYIAQLAVYRDLLAGLYPDRPVRTALLWTATAELTPIH